MSEQNVQTGFGEIDYEVYPGGESPGNYEQLEVALAVANARGMPLPPLMSTERLSRHLVEQRGIWSSSEITAERDVLLERIQYRHMYGAGLEPQLEKIPFFKRAGDRVLTYSDKFRKTRHERGKDEAAEWGLAEIEGSDAVVFSTNYEFMGGSLSAVAGEVFERAAQYAARHKLPIVTVYSTGGARQDENTGALFQMPRLASAINNYREKHPDGAIISVLLGEVWGGISASSMPLADLRVAYTGSRMGFAGARVIASSRSNAAPMSESAVRQAQRVEAHALVRNVDVLVADTDELLDVVGTFIGRMNDHGKKDKNPFTDSALKEQAMDPELLQANGRILDIGRTAIVSSVKSLRRADVKQKLTVTPRGEEPGLDKEALLNSRYRTLMYDAARPDTDMFISSALDHPSQLYNRFVDKEGNIYYPRMIAAIGNIGLQPFMVLGHQASFFRQNDSFGKYPSIPSPNDFRYAIRMLKMGAQHRLPLITITDTLGAEASIAAEHAGQFEQIAEILALYDQYPAPVISMVPGILGSGGGLTAGTRADSLAMTDRALMMVAETRSAAAIVHNVTNPTVEQERETLLGLDPSSEQQARLGIVDAVIPEFDNPYRTIQAMREHVIDTYGKLSKHSLRSILRERERRMTIPLAFRVTDSNGHSNSD